MKKILAIILCAISIFSFMGCSLFEEKIYEHEDFRYIFEKTKDGEKVVRILGLTEDGKKKETIVIPHKLKNYDIKYIGRYRQENFYYPVDVVDRISGKYQKLYIQASAGLAKMAMQRGNDEVELFINSNFQTSFISDEQHRQFFYPGSIGEGEMRSIKVYVNNAIDNMVLNEWTGEKEQFFYNTWMVSANLQFDWNIKDIHQDIYWIDNVKTGSKIVAPPTPTRKSFAFDGWYKEKECINKWDFETDVTKTMLIEDGQEITLEMQESENYTTYLYAKWI